MQKEVNINRSPVLYLAGFAAVLCLILAACGGSSSSSSLASYGGSTALASIDFSNAPERGEVITEGLEWGFAGGPAGEDLRDYLWDIVRTAGTPLASITVEGGGNEMPGGTLTATRFSDSAGDTDLALTFTMSDYCYDESLTPEVESTIHRR